MSDLTEETYKYLMETLKSINENDPKATSAY